MTVDLTSAEVVLLRMMLSSATLSPQGTPAASIIPTVQLIAGLWLKLGGQVEEVPLRQAATPEVSDSGPAYVGEHNA